MPDDALLVLGEISDHGLRLDADQLASVRPQQCVTMPCFQVDMASSDVLPLFDAERPSWSGDGPRPVRAHLWRPARGGRARGTILVSHGSGGAARQMAWLNEPLAAAGFLAIAVDHHGNNLVDGYLAEGFARWWERARDLSVVPTSRARASTSYRWAQPGSLSRVHSCRAPRCADRREPLRRPMSGAVPDSRARVPDPRSGAARAVCAPRMLRGGSPRLASTTPTTASSPGS